MCLENMSVSENMGRVVNFEKLPDQWFTGKNHR